MSILYLSRNNITSDVRKRFVSVRVPRDLLDVCAMIIAQSYFRRRLRVIYIEWIAGRLISAQIMNVSLFNLTKLTPF